MQADLLTLGFPAHGFTTVLGLGLLHRAGEIAVPRTAEELHVALGRPEDFRATGCMAYATLTAA